MPKSLEEVLREYCSPDCILPYIKDYTKSMLVDNEEAFEEMASKDPHLATLCLHLTHSAYGAGFADAVIHVVRVLHENGFIKK